MTATDETAPGKVTADPAAEGARLRQAARALLADLAVQQRVMDELRALADEQERGFFSSETRLRVIFERLGLPAGEPWKHGALDVHSAAALLAEEVPSS